MSDDLDFSKHYAEVIGPKIDLDNLTSKEIEDLNIYQSTIDRMVEDFTKWILRHGQHELTRVVFKQGVMTYKCNTCNELYIAEGEL